MNGAITDVLLNMAPPPKKLRVGRCKKVIKAFIGSNWPLFPALPISWLGSFASDPVGNIFKQSNHNLHGKKFCRTATLTRTSAALNFKYIYNYKYYYNYYLCNNIYWYIITLHYHIIQYMTIDDEMLRCTSPWPSRPSGQFSRWLEGQDDFS